MKSTQFLRSTLASCLASALILSSAQSYADDTEIFFSSADTSVEVTKPNVLFILDNSGSMNWGLTNNNNATGGTKSRLTVLKESFSDIMGNTSGINAGVMVLNSRGEYGSSRYMYPVTDVDQTVPSGNALSANTPGILVSGDDATQANTIQGAVIDAPTLVMGKITVSNTVADTATSTLTNDGIYFRKTVSGQEYVCRMRSNGLTRNVGTPCRDEATRDPHNLRNNAEALFHFQSLSIPASATIKSAYIAMTAENDISNWSSNSTRNPNVSVRVESNKAPATLNDNELIGTRSYLTTATIRTTGGWRNGNPVYIDVTSQLNALRSVSPATDPISSVLMRLNVGSDSANYTICTAGTCIPKLIVEYDTSSSADETRMAALRFQDVGIPAGATIDSATISFVPAASSTGGDATFEVRAENSASPSVFTAGSNLDVRPKSAAIDWVAPDWVAGPTPAPLVGPDVTSLVQGIVNGGSWCGNNAMAFYISPKAGNTSNRVAYSVDGAGGLQPVLNISYSGGNGCINSILELRVNAEKDDARESSNGTVSVAGNTLPLDTAMIAARFEQVRILNNASILDAQLVVTPSNTVSSPNVTSSIRFEQADNSSGLISEEDNLSDRSKTSGTSCTFNDANGGWTAGQPVSCAPSGLASDLQSIFARSGWTANNAISVFLGQSSNSSLDAIAYEQNPSQAIKLRLKVAWGGLADQGTVTVRDDMIARVNSMFAESGTPIVPTMYDAAQYLRDDISGRPTPITTSCQPTHVVLLTDGQANGNTDSAMKGIADIAGSCESDATDDGEKCARTLATFLADQDQLGSLPGDQKVITHTVGFALDASGTTASASIKAFLEDIAKNGDGSFNTAGNAGELTKAFNKILGEVLATDTTFVSASAPVNTFNRQDNKDELYFSLFRPAATDRWLGNLKRYRMATDNGEAWIVDRDGSPAIDPNSGFFKATARSWWTPANLADGSTVAAGGAASQLGNAANRNNLFTNVSGTNALTAIAENNSALTKEKLGLAASAADAERTDLISYIRGLDNGAERKAMGDPIHATPSLVTYRCNTFTAGVCTNEEQSAILGTNEGFVQMFNTNDGTEQFAFMPEVLLPNIQRLMENEASTQHSSKSHPYGMDNTVTVWANDVNNNGGILSSSGAAETGEFVYAYATMGRGGRDIYALDITNRTSPTLLWKIQGGSGSFTRLSQTWSAPVRTKINVGGTDTDVLVFGGGYDPDQDNVTVRTADDQGNDLYIVNARTGSLIWSASTAGISGMNYSIPSGVSVIGLQTDANGNAYVDPNGLAGQIFVGDMGGQVWRFHVNNGQSGSGLVTGGIFASVAGSDAAGARRFYHEPEIALAYVNNSLNLTVNIGSGYRGHPLNKVIEDRFYSFRSENLNSTGGVLTEAQLYDATSLTTATEEQVQDLLAESGWYIRLTRSGEKVLSRPLVADGKLFFNTYEPRVAQNACKAAAGTTRAYSVSLLDSTAFNTTRDLDTKGSSLPSNPQLFCKGNTCWAYNDPSQLVKDNDGSGGSDEECANSPNPEKCRCDKNPICIWMPSTPRTFWTDERSN